MLYECYKCCKYVVWDYHHIHVMLYHVGIGKVAWIWYILILLFRVGVSQLSIQELEVSCRLGPLFIHF